MRIIFTKTRKRVLSGFFGNLSAGWVGAILVFPNFLSLTHLKDIFVLLTDIFAAIVCLVLAF